MQHFNTAFNNLIRELQGALGQISHTVNGWDTHCKWQFLLLITLIPARKAYLGVIIHWHQKGAIENQVVLTSAVGGFQRIHGSHNGILRYTISACLSNAYSLIADNLAATLLFVLNCMPSGQNVFCCGSLDMSYIRLSQLFVRKA